MFLLNFKTYPEATGEKAVALFNIVAEIANRTKVKFVVCPAHLDLATLAKLSEDTNVEVWAQHVEPSDPGQSTGHLTPEGLVQAGVEGVILNHSEHKLVLGLLNETTVRAKDTGLKTLIFADNLKEAEAARKLKPDWIGYEPSELVGSAETSVSKSKPEIISKVVEKMGERPVLVGAGIKDTEDVSTAIKLGARGIGVASSVILSENPKQVIESLLKGFDGMRVVPQPESMPHQDVAQPVQNQQVSAPVQQQPPQPQNIGVGVAPNQQMQTQAKKDQNQTESVPEQVNQPTKNQQTEQAGQET